MGKQWRQVAWTASAVLIWAIMMGCAFNEQAAFEQRVQKMSDTELAASIQNLRGQIKDINRTIRRDRKATESRHGFNPVQNMGTHFSSRRVDLRAKEEILLKEVKMRRRHRFRKPD